MPDNEVKRTILFVDDEKNILTSLKRLFRPEGYTIFIASSGAAGLNILRENNIDIVISDMRMPEMDGAQFLEKVSKSWPHTMRLLLTGYADINSTIDAINKGNVFRYISKPWADNDIILTVENALKYKFLKDERAELLELTNKQNGQLKSLNKQLDNKVRARTEELRQAISQLQITNDSLKKQYISTVNIFTHLIEIRIGSVTGHYRQVAELSRRLAKEVGLDVDHAQDVMFAALLLDIGKIGLPDHLLKIPYDKVPSLEKPKYEKHTIMGEAALMTLEPLQGAATVIRNHAEKYDGSGFPDRLKGNDIPLGSRIIALSNDYVSLLNGTLLQRRLTLEETKSYISRQRGKRYDPALVDILYPHSSALVDADKNDKDYFTTPKQLKSGMVVSKDFTLENGMLLVAKGQALTDNLISKIQKLESSMNARFRVYIKNTV